MCIIFQTYRQQETVICSVAILTSIIYAPLLLDEKYKGRNNPFLSAALTHKCFDK